MQIPSIHRTAGAAACIALLSSPAWAQGSVIKGSAGTSGGKGDGGLEHCDKPMAAVAVVEPQSEYMMMLSRYNLGSPTGLIRLMIQQSNCFIVVERGQGMRNMAQERELADSGQLRSNSNMGGGQMVGADFILTPAVVFQENNAGGVGGAVGGLLGRRAPVAGAVAGGVKFREAQTSMLLSDSRSGVQVAAAEGSTRKADIRAGISAWGGGSTASVGGYGNTNEGKLIAAALQENYNKIVETVRGDASLQRNVGTLKEEAALGGTRRAGAVFNEGDVLGPKINGVKIMADAADSAKVEATLGRADEVVVIGEEKNGFIQVQGSDASGWVKISLMQKR